jgi:hypothetical protein
VHQDGQRIESWRTSGMEWGALQPMQQLHPRLWQPQQLQQNQWRRGGAVVPATANISAMVLSILPLLKSSLEKVLYYVFRVQEMKHPRKESPMWIWSLPYIHSVEFI